MTGIFSACEIELLRSVHLVFVLTESSPPLTAVPPKTTQTRALTLTTARAR